MEGARHFPDRGDAGRMSRFHRWAASLYSIATLAFVLSVGLVPAGAAPLNSQPTAITDPACPGVQLAPEVATDRNHDGTPVRMSLDRRGKYVPVIFVHGWTGRAAHGVEPTGAFSHLMDLSTDPYNQTPGERSLIGQIQSLGGTAAFTFDYHNQSARWVTDSHLGPALAEAIDCLYAATGERVIVVAHSMGGLLARHALTQAPGHQERLQKVSRVVTLGTPQSGSFVAALIAGEIEERSAVLRVLLAGCGELATASLTTGTVCDWLPGFVRAFDSEAGRGLRAGSAELRALPPWPSAVPLHAVGSDATFAVPERTGWFGLRWKTTEVPVGDLIVDSPSATAGSMTQKLGRCAYQLNVVRGAADSIALSVGLAAYQDVAQQPLEVVTGACFHGNLMRTIQLTNEVMGVIVDDVDGRQPVVEADLLNAFVPSLCEHPQGNLVEGELPGIPEQDGVVVIETEGGRIPPNRVAFGDLRGAGPLDAAVAVFCNRGGVSWPEYVLLYGPGPTHLGGVWLADLADGRQSVRSVTIADGLVHVEFVNTYGPGEGGCCGSVDGIFDLRVVDGSTRVENLAFFDGRSAAKRFLDAGIQRDVSAMEAVGPGMSDGMLTLIQLVGTGLELGPCEPQHESWSDVEVACAVAVPDLGLPQAAAIGLKKIGFATWQVIEVRFDD